MTATPIDVMHVFPDNDGGCVTVAGGGRAYPAAVTVSGTRAAYGSDGLPLAVCLLDGTGLDGAYPALSEGTYLAVRAADVGGGWDASVDAVLSPEPDAVSGAAGSGIVTVEVPCASPAAAGGRMYAYRMRSGRLMGTHDLLVSERIDDAFMRGNAKPVGAGAREDGMMPAAYKLDRTTVNHALSERVLINGVTAIANGEPRYDLSPKSPTGECYTLISSEETCVNYLFREAGNGWFLRAVLDTVNTLRKDRRGEGFLYEGYVWFSTYTIMRELLRTSGGTVANPRSAKAMARKIDAALLVLQTSTIAGIAKDGTARDSEYVLNARRRSTVTHNGVTYKDVWGFTTDPGPLDRDDGAMNNLWRYPLLDAPSGLDADRLSARTNLLDILNEARGRLYRHGASGEVRNRNRGAWTVRRSWDGIFATMAPLAPEVPSRRKKAIVSAYQDMLCPLAEQDAAGEVHEGRPLWIRAWSEPKKGMRGRPTWGTLVIEAHSEKTDVSVAVDTMARGALPEEGEDR